MKNGFFSLVLLMFANTAFSIAITKASGFVLGEYHQVEATFTLKDIPASQINAEGSLQDFAQNISIFLPHSALVPIPYGVETPGPSFSSNFYWTVNSAEIRDDVPESQTKQITYDVSIHRSSFGDPAAPFSEKVEEDGPVGLIVQFNPFSASGSNLGDVSTQLPPFIIPKYFSFDVSFEL